MRRPYSKTLLSFLLLLLAAAPGSADGLALPGKGKIEIVDLATVQVSKALKLKGSDVPVLAGHPSAPVLASLSDKEGLVFWNVPSFTEASQVSDPSFDGVVAMRFSPAGDRLYMLSLPLKALLVYSLQTSKVESVYPVPGGDPVGLQVEAQGLVVRQKDGLCILDPSSGGLLAQWRTSGAVAAAWLEPKALVLAVSAQPGLLRYSPKNGEPLSSKGGSANYADLLGAPSGALLAVAVSESSLESWGENGTLSWKTPLSPGSHSLYRSRDGAWVYAVGKASKTLSVLEASSGRELGKLPLDSVDGEAALFSTP